MKLKKLLVCISILIIPFSVFSQNAIGIKINQRKPSGLDYGPYLDKSTSIDISWQFSYMEDQFQASLFTGFHKFESLSNKGMTYTKSGSSFYIDGKDFIKHNAIPLGVSTDFKLFKNSKFTPLLGCDYFVVMANVVIDTGDSWSYYDGRTYYFGVTPKVELMYEITKELAVSLGWGKTITTFESESTYFSYWNTYAKVKYYLN